MVKHAQTQEQIEIADIQPFGQLRQVSALESDGQPQMLGRKLVAYGNIWLIMIDAKNKRSGRRQMQTDPALGAPQIENPKRPAEMLL